MNRHQLNYSTDSPTIYNQQAATVPVARGHITATPGDCAAFYIYSSVRNQVKAKTTPVYREI